MAADPNSLWTVSQVAKRLGCVPRTVYRMVEERKIPFIPLLGLRFDPAKIEKWLEKKGVVPA